MRIHIAYATKEGQTAKIANYIAEVVRAQGHQVDTVEIVHAEEVVPAGFDGVIVGSSIHMGKHDKHAAEYVRYNREALEKVPQGPVTYEPGGPGPEEAKDLLRRDGRRWTPIK